tara:strand:+ start:4251 stop:4439 length:189 start_codon:yes stop_codon:yes gene_type:complete
MNEREMITIYMVQVFSQACEMIKEIEFFEINQAREKRNRLLGDGEIARIREKRVPFEDYIPF